MLATTIRSLCLLCVILVSTGCEQRLSGGLRIAEQGIYHGSLSNDGRYALVASIHHGARLWDLQQEALLYSWSHAQQGYSDILFTALSPEAKFALTADKRTLAPWYLQDGQAQGFWSMPADIRSAALGASGRYAALGLQSGEVIFTDLGTGQFNGVFPHGEAVRSVAISADSRFIASGGVDHLIKLWSLTDGELLAVWPQPHHVIALVFSSDGQRLLAASSRGGATVYDLRRQTELWTLSDPNTIKSAAFSQDNQRLLVGSASQGVQLWQVGQEKPLAKWRLERAELWKPTAGIVYDVAFSADERSATAVLSNGLVQRWPLP